MPTRIKVIPAYSEKFKKRLIVFDSKGRLIPEDGKIVNVDAYIRKLLQLGELNEVKNGKEVKSKYIYDGNGKVKLDNNFKPIEREKVKEIKQTTTRPKITEETEE